ncbi:hypothetical protein EZV73_20155 [Acidaminobacter sp. JC074]|uniref:ATP-binding protein n=1 Tax=Acidaminobacter sp. JC074 TaxID=2530199 RepID=UPI001F113C3C|nr:ATP-binding protein [Acidaminobacter sp. JC074]MCH4889904.1 hypothetical protein [Acidaminobacter sp. JC074]
MKNYIKQILSLIIIVATALLIYPRLNHMTSAGIIRLIHVGEFELIAVCAIILYLGSKIYHEMTSWRHDRENLFIMIVMMLLSSLMVIQLIYGGRSYSELGLRMTIFYRFFLILGMLYIIEVYVFENVVNRYRIAFSTVMIILMIFTFIFTLDLMSELTIGYYFVALAYLMVMYLNWQMKGNTLDRLRTFAVFLISLALINDILVVAYDMSSEMSFIVVALMIGLVISGKVLQKEERYSEKLNEIKSLNTEIRRLNRKKRELETNAIRTKNEFANLNSTRQSYYENLELVIDVLNTNVLVINEDYNVEMAYGILFEYNRGEIVDASKLLFEVGNEDSEYFKSVVQKVFKAEDQVRELLFLSLLDKHLTIQNVPYAMQYQMMTKNQGEKVLIVHAELKDEYDYQGEHEEEKEIAEMVTAVVRNTDMFFSDLSSFLDFAKNISKILDSDETLEDNIFKVLRRVHTYKGVFDQYNMNATVRGITDVENELFNSLHNIQGLTLDHFTRVLIAYDLEGVIEMDIQLLRQRLGEKFFDNRTKMGIDISSFNRVYLSLTDKLGVDHELVKEMETLKKVDLRDIMLSFKEYILRLAEKQGKMVNYVVKGDPIKINRQAYIEFIEGLIHILKNSVTHGAEYPDERMSVGKDEVTTISCFIRKKGSDIQLTISDDGKGIDIKEIKNRLFILGKFSIDELDQLSDLEVANMVIEDGVTSYLTPTTVAGRGVGMGSIKEIVDKVGGSIEVKTVAGQGVSYEIIIPNNHDEMIVRFDNEEVLRDFSLQAERILTKSENKQRLSSSWQFNKLKMTEDLLLDVSSYLSLRSYAERKVIITADENFIYQLIGSYGMSMKYKGSNINVMNEVLCKFIDDVVEKTIDSLRSDRQKVDKDCPVIMGKTMFEQIVFGKEVVMSEMHIPEGSLKIIVIEH